MTPDTSKARKLIERAQRETTNPYIQDLLGQALKPPIFQWRQDELPLMGCPYG